MKGTEIRATDIIMSLYEYMVRPHIMYFVLYSSSLKRYYVARKDAKKTIKMITGPKQFRRVKD